LKEYDERGHAGGIMDRRFGENDPSMSLEERMLERFTKERQRSSKNSVFNLEDEDELTHYGQSLSNLDDFDNVGLTMDDQDDEDRKQALIYFEVLRSTHILEAFDTEMAQKVNFGGFDDDDEEDHDEEDGQVGSSKHPARLTG
jgi:nucleolar protein 14